MARTGAGPALIRTVYTDETKTFVLKTQGKQDLGLQWVQFSGAGSATIVVKGTISTVDALIADADFADIRWSSVPDAVFASLPSGVPSSDMLFASENAIVALIVQIVFSGTVELEFNVNAQSRGA